MPLAIAYAIQAIDTLPKLIAAGVDLIAWYKNINDQLKDMRTQERDPTDMEWAALNAQIETLRAQRPDVG